MGENLLEKTKPPTFLSRDMLAFEQGLPLTLRLTFHSNSTSLVKVVGFSKHGAFSFEVEPVGDLTQESRDFRITDFPIMLSIVTDDDTIVRGDVYAKVELLLRETVHATLAQGYVSSLNSPSWPHGTQEDSFSGHGKITVITGANPPTGDDFTVTVPPNVIWRLMTLAVRLVTDETVAARKLRVVLSDGTSDLAFLIPVSTQTASVVRTYFFLSNPFTADNQDGGQTIGPIPIDMFLPAGFTISSDLRQGQAGDEIDAPILSVEQWILPS